MWKLAAILISVCFTATATIIPTERLVPGGMWTNAGVSGGIPSVTTIYTNFTTSVTLNQLNYALQHCPSNQVVKLGSGSYSFSGMIDFGQTTGVVLRGNGKTNTFINIAAHAGSANIMIGEDTVGRVDATTLGTVYSWTNGYGQGTNTIYLSSVSGLAVGKILALDQLNNNTWVDDDVQEGCTYCGRASGERMQVQYVRITAINGNAVTISPGLYMMNWASAYTPQAWIWNESDTAMCGVEDLSLTNALNSGTWAITISQARDCWVKDVNMYTTPQAAVANPLTKNCEFRRVSMLSNQGAGNLSYGIIFYMTSDSLMVDCIADNITAAMVLSPQAQGNVVAYNYFTNAVYEPSNWDIASMSSHDGHVCMNLIEGNWANKIYVDSIHGSESHMTIARNYFHGHQVNRDNNTMAFCAEQYCLSNNLVGNIFGTSGFHTPLAVTNQTLWDAGADDAIYILGNGNSADGIPWDSRVPQSTLIHGNYDTLTASIRWDSNIADTTIPTSYYLSAKPSWWGDRPWPWLNPTNTSAASTSPTNFPAGYRYIYGTDPPADSGSSSGNRSATVSGTFRAY